MNDRHSGTSHWLPLLGVFVIAMVLCSGIATLLLGQTIGQYVAMTLVALLVFFVFVSLFTRLLIANTTEANRRRETDD